jgi:hypothetical protein
VQKKQVNVLMSVTISDFIIEGFPRKGSRQMDLNVTDARRESALLITTLEQPIADNRNRVKLWKHVY